MSSSSSSSFHQSISRQFAAILACDGGLEERRHGRLERAVIAALGSDDDAVDRDDGARMDWIKGDKAFVAYLAERNRVLPVDRESGDSVSTATHTTW